MYKTAEHCYHCQRYQDRAILLEIKNARSPDEAWKISQQYKKFQKDDFEEKKRDIMKEILLAKLSQHNVVRDFLVQT
jgi:predicted NAD-dependent protein-ADP-ribosyltransferase YbiA (DUF1768 family)